MAKNVYPVIDGVTRKQKKAYAVIDGYTRTITKMYAVIDGVTRLIWNGSDNIDYVFTGIMWYMGSINDSRDYAIKKNDEWAKEGDKFNTYPATIYSEDGKYLVTRTISNISLRDPTLCWKWNGTDYDTLEFSIDFKSFISAYEPFLSASDVDCKDLVFSFDDSSKFAVLASTEHVNTNNSNYYDLNSNIVICKIQNGNVVIDKIYTGTFNYTQGYSIYNYHIAANPNLSIVEITGYYKKTNGSSYIYFKNVCKLNADGSISTLLNETYNGSIATKGFFTEDGKYYISRPFEKVWYKVYYISGDTLTLLNTVTLGTYDGGANILYDKEKQILMFSSVNNKIIYFYQLSNTSITDLGNYVPSSNEDEDAYSLRDITNNGLYAIALYSDSDGTYLREIKLSRGDTGMIVSHGITNEGVLESIDSESSSDYSFYYARYIGDNI